MARTVIGSVAIHLEGSFDFSNPVVSEKVLIFHLVPMKNRGEDNPARAFRISFSSLVPQSELGPFAQKYKASMVESAKQEQAHMRTLLPSTMDPSFSGVLPSVSLMANTGLFYTSNCHINRTYHRRIVGERWRAVIQDVSAMCMDAMNAGYVLRPGPTDDVPDVGTLVRRKKKWEWVREEGWRWEWDYLASRMPPRQPRLTDLDPHQPNSNTTEKTLREYSAYILHTCNTAQPQTTPVATGH